jgi:hypothetical protein
MISISFFYFQSCTSNSYERNHLNKSISKRGANKISDSLEIKANRLKEAYKKNDYSTFLITFPNSFTEFSDLYDYNEEKGEKLLYSVYEKHISFLFDSVGSREKQLCSKAFNIASQGKWDADAVGYFQNKLSELIKNKPNSLIELLSSKSLEAINNFWFFVFDGSSSNDIQIKELFNNIYLKINSIDKKQGSLLFKKFNEMYK